MTAKNVFLIAATSSLAYLGCSNPAQQSEVDAGIASSADANVTTSPDAAAPRDVVYLKTVPRLARASMALRGIRPSAEEIAAVQADPNAFGEIVDSYLQTPQFGETIRDLHNEALLTRYTVLPFFTVDDLANISGGKLMSSLGEEPLKLIENVVMTDRPYTEIVTADYTMADEVVATAYGLPYAEADGGWQKTFYQDGRPNAGVISTTAFLTRHRSAGINWNRGRANAVSKALLCYDFLHRDVVLDASIDLSDPQVIADAVINNQACASCHHTLDPLASYMWGFDPSLNGDEVIDGGYPIQNFFQTKFLTRWKVTSKRAPSFFGKAGATMTDLGQLIAEDPRFSLCAAKRFYSYFSQVTLDEVPLKAASELQEKFIASGYSAKALAKAIVMSDEFAASYTETDLGSEHLIGLKKARPEQLARLFYDLTGFRWKTYSKSPLRGSVVGQVEDLMKDDVVGFRMLAGGIDSFYVNEPSHTFNLTYSLTMRTFAAEAAGYVVETDFAQAAHARKLLLLVDADTTDETAVRAQLAALFIRLYGETEGGDDPVEQEDLDLAYALFTDTLTRTSDVKHAWKTTLTALLQDLKISTY